MRRLLWKELREKLIWALLLIAAAPGVIVFGDGYTFCGDEFGGWITISAIAAFLLGGSAYSSELAGGRADFLFSRRISWEKVLLAKFLVGLAVVLVTAIVGALAYRLVCPAPLLPFATPFRLAEGVAYATIWMGICYVAGFLCSTALPGVFGSVLVYFAILTAYGVPIAILGPSMHSTDAQGFGALGGWALGAIVATVVTARFGLTLNTTARAARYALTVAVIGIVVGSGAFWALGKTTFFDHQSDRPSFISLSPNGRYAVVQYPARSGATTSYDEIHLVKRSDDSRVLLADRPQSRTQVPYDYGQITQCYWVDNTNIAMVIDRGGGEVRFIHIRNADRPLEPGSVSINEAGVRERSLLVPSPNRKLAVVVSDHSGVETWRIAMRDIWQRTGGANVNGNLAFFNALTGRGIGKPVRGVRNFWWQSDTEVGYVDNGENRHIVRVVP